LQDQWKPFTAVLNNNANWLYLQLQRWPVRV